MKYYDERDLMMLDKAGNYYSRHIQAMTAEQLESKSDIAAELAWRDYQIEAMGGADIRVDFTDDDTGTNVDIKSNRKLLRLPRSGEEVMDYIGIVEDIDGWDPSLGVVGYAKLIFATKSMAVYDTHFHGSDFTFESEIPQPTRYAHPDKAAKNFYLISIKQSN